MPRQTKCGLCGEVGHDRRNCNWDNIERLHNIGRKLYIDMQIRNTEFNSSLCSQWRTHIKKVMKQTLITRYGSLELVREYTDISEWRNRESYLFDTIPVQSMVFSRNTTNTDLDLMLDIVYAHISNERVQLSPDMLEEATIFDLGMEIRENMSVFRRNIINRSLTSDGFDTYLDQIINYLQNIRDNHEAGTRRPVFRSYYLNENNSRESWNLDDVYELTTGREIPYRSDGRARAVEQYLENNSGKRKYNITLEAVEMPIEGGCGVCWEENKYKNMETNCQHRFCNTCVKAIMDNEMKKKRDRIVGGDIILKMNCPLCRGEVTNLTHVVCREEHENLNTIRNMTF